MSKIIFKFLQRDITFNKFFILIFIIFIFSTNSEFAISKTLEIGDDGAVSLAFNFHDVDQITADNSMFKSRRSINVINVNTFLSDNTQKFIFVPLGVLADGMFQLDLFLRPHKKEYSKGEYFVVASSDKFNIKNFSLQSEFEKLKRTDIKGFLRKHGFKQYNSESDDNTCLSKTLGSLIKCSKVFMNQYKNVNYGKFNELKTVINIPGGADGRFFGLIIELDRFLSFYDVKDGYFYQDIGQVSILANQKFPNFVDYLPLTYPKEKSQDSFIGIKAVGNSSYFFKINMPKKGETYFSFKLAHISNTAIENSGKIDKIHPFRFKVTISCQNKVADIISRDFIHSDVQAIDRIFFEQNIPISPKCPSGEVVISLITEFEKKSGILFVVDPVVYNISNKKRPNLILITADALRYDHTSLSNYIRDTTPFLKAFAKNGVSFSKYIVQRSFTSSSLPIIFTGQYPYRLKEVQQFERKQNSYFEYDIHKVLFQNGYNAYSIIGSKNFGKLTTSNRFANRTLFNSDISDFESLLRGYQFIKQQEKNRPYFLWVHLKRPHFPYNPESKFKKFSKNYSAGIKWFNDKEKIELFSRHKKISNDELDNIIGLYDDNISNMDHDISTFLSTLLKEKMLDDTVIALTTDHGENMNEHGQYFQHGTISNACLNVPLVLIYPKKISQNVKVDSIVESIDLFPTILDLLDIEIPAGIDGKSLIGLINNPNFPHKKYAYSDLDGKFFSVQNLEYKLIVNPHQESIEGVNFYFPYTHKKLELYHLKSDPLEKNNIFDQNPEVAYNLLEKLIPYMKKFEQREEGGQFTPEMLDLLERTGYLHWKKIKK
ncbi:MAG: sulfatase [Oligoflexia bacterium]|nr:sulfatase [Oligoflexia bacterium]